MSKWVGVSLQVTNKEIKGGFKEITKYVIKNGNEKYNLKITELNSIKHIVFHMRKEFPA